MTGPDLERLDERLRSPGQRRGPRRVSRSERLFVGAIGCLIAEAMYLLLFLLVTVTVGFVREGGHERVSDFEVAALAIGFPLLLMGFVASTIGTTASTAVAVLCGVAIVGLPIGVVIGNPWMSSALLLALPGFLLLGNALLRAKSRVADGSTQEARRPSPGGSAGT